MSADDDQKPSHRFSVEDARARAQQALHKSEFILSRAYGLLREPKKEWEQIRAEQTTVPSILFGYVAPLAAIIPVCSLIGSYIFERQLAGDFGVALIRAVVTWIVSVVLVFFLGVLINAVAENFDGDKNDLNAHKIAAYSLTPTFLSGVFGLWPPLWWLSLFALAAMVFLMYRGLPLLMKAPPEQALPYAGTVTVATAVAYIVLFSIAAGVVSG
jgi:uncharacterized membrane protein